MPDDAIRLVVYPEPHVFDSRDAGPFRAFLDDQDRHTVITTIDRPGQILLTEECLTEIGDLRLSSVAFRQLCQCVCPGLSSVVSDISGLRRPRNEPGGSHFSFEDAVLIFNTAVRRRFSARLESMQMVRDTRTGTIDGVVSRTYRRLSNLELYQRSDETLQSYRVPVEFHQARVYGRYLVLSYRDREPLVSLRRRHRPDDFHGGLYYSNSETGDGSVRATASVIRALDDSRAINAFTRRNRIIHAGSDFHRRFEMMLDIVVSKRQDADIIRAGLERLVETPLRLGEQDDEIEERFKELVHVLRARQLPNGVATRIVRGVLAQSSYDAEPMENLRFTPREEWATRSLFDLFNSMTRVSKNLPITLQEQVEHLAYQLLTGRFQPVK